MFDASKSAKATCSATAHIYGLACISGLPVSAGVLAALIDVTDAACVFLEGKF